MPEHGGSKTNEVRTKVLVRAFRGDSVSQVCRRVVSGIMYRLCRSGGVGDPLYLSFRMGFELEQIRQPLLVVLEVLHYQPRLRRRDQSLLVARNC